MSLTSWALRTLNLANAYRKTFLADDGRLSKHGEMVMADLAKFCRAHEPTTRVSPVTRTIDPLAMAQAEGRREAYLRILWHLKINDADLLNIREEQDNG